MGKIRKRSVKQLDAVATGLKLKKLMDKQDITIRDLSNYMGISFQAVYKWQTGESLPTINNLYIIAQILNISVDDILVAQKKK